ncbi:MAG TPA: replication-associated recombination protein A [Armatimonadota bacterium]|nr:replication-associated recombination protein A [Armatimonadota bacterium]
MTLFDPEPPSPPTADVTAQPLAARMRPVSLEEFVGQQHILGPGKLLRRAIEADELMSAIFWGPPGCGKSTLASVIARHTRSSFETLSAVTAGVADVRKIIAAARERWSRLGIRTTLFVDEIHRFNRSQQDAFLPHVEDGTIVLIGATTENPYFEVNSPLLSRSRVFRFEPLSEDDLRRLVDAALADAERGLGALRPAVTPDALAHLLDQSNGDARSLLNALEAAVLAAPEVNGVREVTLDLAEEAMQQRSLAYDPTGDSHYDIISAFIKSLRGSDPDAALYWMARMIASGEDPRFIARRMIVHASEDVGNADPMALLIATAAAHAVEYVGLPEARIPMAQAAIYIACAPKSNSTVVAIGRAMKDAQERKPAPVPPPLRDSHYKGAAKLGHGKGYLYPHDYPGHFVAQEHAPPDAMSGPYYEPSDQGREKAIGERLAAWSEARAEDGG